MSIVKYIEKDEYPNEGDIVYCDNGKYSPDRAIYRNGEFIGGGEFPIPSYKMSCVSKWFNLSEYGSHKNKAGKNSYCVSFEDAESMA
jgi:hypothetical protein